MKPSKLPASRRGVSRKGFIPEDIIPASRGGVSAEAMTPRGALRRPYPRCHPEVHRTRDLLVFFLLFFLASPAYLSIAETKTTWQGLVEIESDRLYMLSVGADAGLQKGDRVDVLREDARIATLRLTSVLADSSMAEVVEIFGSNTIQDTDSIVCPRLEPRAIEKKASKSKVEAHLPPQETSLGREDSPQIPMPQEGEERPVVIEKAEEVKAPPHHIAAAGDQSSQQDREEQIRTLGRQLEQAKIDKDKEISALTAKFQEKDVLIDSLSKEKYKISFNLEQSQKEIADLKNDITGLKKEVDSVKTFRSTSGKAGDDPFEKRVDKLNQNLADIQRQCQEEISIAREEARQQLFGEYDRWQQKISDAKEGYEGQFEKQLQILKEKEALVKSLQGEKFGLAADLGDRDQQLGALKKEVAVLRKDLESAKATPAEKLRITQESLDEKIKELSALKSEYSERVKSLEAETEQKILAERAKGENKIQAMKEEHETKLAGQKSDYDNRLKSSSGLRAELKEKENRLVSLDKEKAALLSDLKRGEEQVVASKGEIASLKNQLTEFQDKLKTSQAMDAEKIQSIKAPLEEKIEGLNKILFSLEQTYEQKLAAAIEEKERVHSEAKAQWEKERQGAEAALNSLKEAKEKERLAFEAQIKEQGQTIESLSKDKSNLAQDVQHDEQRLIRFKEQVDELTKELDALRASQAEQIQLAKNPLEKKIEVLNNDVLSLKNTYEEKLSALKAGSQQTLLEERQKWQEQMGALEKGKDGYITALLSELKDKQTALNDLNTKNSDLSSRLNNSEKELTDLKKETAGLKKELEVITGGQAEKIRLAKLPLEERIEALNKDLISLTKGYQEKLTSQERELRQSLTLEQTQLKTQLEEATRQYETKLAAQNTAWENKLNDHQAKLYEEAARLKTQYDDLKSQTDRKILTMVAQLDEKQTSIEALSREKAALTAKLDRANAELIQLNQQLGGLREELKNTTAKQAEKIQSTRAPLEEKIQNLNNAVETLKKEHEIKTISLSKESLQTKDKLTADLNELKKQQEKESAARQGREDILRKEKNDLSLSLEQARKQLAKVKEDLAVVKASVQDNSRREILESDRQWEAKLEKIKEHYEAKTQAQQQRWEEQLLNSKDELQSEIAHLTDEFTRLKDDKDSQLFAMQVDYEDKLAGLKEDSQEVIERLQKELSRTKDETGFQEPAQGSLALNPVSKSAAATAALPAPDNAPLQWDDYYGVIREMILNNFKKSDFLAYQNHEDYVRIEFELFSNGSLKERPQFFGTTDERLKEILYQHFLEALPFPPFPGNIKKRAQRFTIIISFKNQ